MKKLFLILLVVPMVGCANYAKVVREFAKDPAAARLSIMTPYGSMIYERANPGTNQLAVGPNGITTKP